MIPSGGDAMMGSFTLDLQPIGRRIEILPGESILAAVQRAGISLVADCNGAGRCGRCRVRVVAGVVSSPTSAETRVFDTESLAGGWRLACQCHANSTLTIEVSPESLPASQRLQLEGNLSVVAPDPLLAVLSLSLPPASLDDLRADSLRLCDSLRVSGVRAPRGSRAFFSDFSDRVRDTGWCGQVVMRGDEITAFLPPAVPLVGLAVDIGTTSIAAYLVRLDTGEILVASGAMNPQIAFGEDVVSRIATCNDRPDGRAVLQARIVAAVSDLAASLCTRVGLRRDHIVDAVVVGNTAMSHLFAGLPVRQLGESPYLPAVSGSIVFPASEVGLALAPAANLFLPPSIAGFIGSDHVAAILATDLTGSDHPTLMLDIGTNTELSLVHEGQLFSTSCASGPAFEGAHISAGMRAAPGAIEAVWIEDDSVRVATIDSSPPVGICGSGILDAVAVMSSAGAINRCGIFLKEHRLLSEISGGRAFLLADGSAPVAVFRQDVAEIQLAKAAIRTGIEAVFAAAGITADAVEEVIIAGAFGSYINVESAIRIGMFPQLPLGRFRQVGNAAGMGAVRMLISRHAREVSESLVRGVRYIELTTLPGFQESFVRWMGF